MERSLNQALGAQLHITEQYVTTETLDCFNPPIRGRWIHVIGGDVINAPTGYAGRYCWSWGSPGSGDCLAFLWSIQQRKLWVAHFHGTNHTGTWKEINLT